MFSPSVSKQAEDVLDDVLRIIQDDYARPHCALFETERKNFVEEEESLRERIKEIDDSASTSSSYSWRNLIGLPPPQAQQCLKDAEALRKRVKGDINEKRRSTLTGRSSLYGSPSNSMGGRMADGRLPVDDTSKPATEIVTSPLNTRCSISRVPGLNVDSSPDSRLDIDDATNTPLGPTSDQRSDFYDGIQPRRISPSPSPQMRRVAASSISETPGSPHRSHSLRGSPLPSSHSPRKSRIHSSHSPVSALLDPAMMLSFANLPQEVYDRQGSGESKDYVTMTNCANIHGSTVDGLTIHNGGSNNSGAVIHKIPSQRYPQNVA